MRIKAEPEDFIVEEVPTEGFMRSMNESCTDHYLVVRAHKRDCAHFDLVRAITRRFSLPESDVGIGGIKDRRAITSQLLTLPNVVRIREAFSGGAIALATDTGEASLELLGSSSRRMTIGSLFGNRFTIRALIDDAEREKLASFGSSVRMPNYFGSQRFGRGRENVSIGYALLTGDFRFVRDTLLSGSSEDPIAFIRRISRRKRMLYVSAFQSAIFNAELVGSITDGVVERIRSGDDPILSLARIADERVYRSVYPDRGAFPILSLGSPLTSFQEELLPILKLSPRSFAIRQLPDMMFEPVMRESCIDVAFDRFELGEDLHISFSLPKGSYATVLLEQLAI